MKKQLITFYLDWSNNYLFAKNMAEDYGLTKEECQHLIEMGRKYHNKEAVTEKKITVGTVLIAKNDFFMDKSGKQFLISGKEYTINADNYLFTLKSEITDNHAFNKKEILQFFTIKP